MAKTIVSSRIQSARHRKGWSQHALAICVGVDKTHVSKWECGRASPSNQHLAQLALALNVSTDYLLGVTDRERRHSTERREET